MVAIKERRYVFEALTRFNYFPNQKDVIGEMPPLFHTVSFTPEIAEKIISSNLYRQGGYDQVCYSVTRHNNVPRTLGLIHPAACSYLAKTIHGNWDDVRAIMASEFSAIKPSIYADGRIMIMNYEDAETKTVRALEDSFSMRFKVETDISSCFGSIYTHSIPWAVIGFEAAKNKLKAKPKAPIEWYDYLDIYQRGAKRNETQGIAIGPASSSIVVELVLGRVDDELGKKGFKFRRYIDDYICFCSTYEDAQDFIRILASELNKFKLNLNLQKTVVTNLPDPTSDHWVSKLGMALPDLIIDAAYGRRKFLEWEVVRFLDYAVRLNKSTPDGSVLKYAVGSIIGGLEKNYSASIFLYVLSLSWHYPVLIPYLERIILACEIDVSDYVDQINLLVAENAKNRRSDGMAWSMYYLRKYELQLSDEAALAVISSEDCVALVCLLLLKPDFEELKGFINGLLDGGDYLLDQYWLLLYQYYLLGKIENPYNDQVFPIMKKYEVNFVAHEEKITRAEQYCDYINNPFADDDFVFESFDEFYAK